MYLLQSLSSFIVFLRVKRIFFRIIITNTQILNSCMEKLWLLLPLSTLATLFASILTSFILIAVSCFCHVKIIDVLCLLIPASQNILVSWVTSKLAVIMLKSYTWVLVKILGLLKWVELCIPCKALLFKESTTTKWAWLMFVTWCCILLFSTFSYFTTK